MISGRGGGFILESGKGKRARFEIYMTMLTRYMYVTKQVILAVGQRQRAVRPDLFAPDAAKSAERDPPVRPVPRRAGPGGPCVVERVYRYEVSRGNFSVHLLSFTSHWLI